MGTAFDVLAPDREHAHLERVVRVLDVGTPEEAMDLARAKGWHPTGWKRADGRSHVHETLTNEGAGKRPRAVKGKPDPGKQLLSEMDADTLVRCVAIGVFRAHFWWALIALGLWVVVAILNAGAGVKP